MNARPRPFPSIACLLRLRSRPFTTPALQAAHLICACFQNAVRRQGTPLRPLQLASEVMKAFKALDFEKEHYADDLLLQRQLFARSERVKGIDVHPTEPCESQTSAALLFLICNAFPRLSRVQCLSQSLFLFKIANTRQLGILTTVRSHARTSDGL